MEYGVVRQRVKGLTKEELEVLRDQTIKAKNLYNLALYHIRNDYFSLKATKKSIRRSRLDDDVKLRLIKEEDKKLLTYTDLYHVLKTYPEYQYLNSGIAQQILRKADSVFRSYLKLIQVKHKKGLKQKISPPKLIHSYKDDYYPLIMQIIYIRKGRFRLPLNKILRWKHKIVFQVPPILEDKVIREIRIIPRQRARFFEIQYTYIKDVSKKVYDEVHALGIDLGVNNLMTCVTNRGKTFIIDGKYIKSINYHANKEYGRLKNILRKQKLPESKLQAQLLDKRDRRIRDIITKACRYVIEYCKKNNIGTLVLGYTEGKNQRVKGTYFTPIPFGILKDTLTYMCRWENIKFIIQDEAYTSVASFWDKDPIEEGIYSGTRINRGLYQASDGRQLNADVNAALNILRKCKVVDLDVLYSRGAVDTPKRIRLE